MVNPTRTRPVIVLFAFVALGSIGCASASGGTVGTAADGSTGSWNGSFKQSDAAMTSAAITMPSGGGSQSAYGRIQLTPLLDVPTASVRADLSIFAPVSGGTQIAWAVFQGPCGAAMPAVANQNAFPLIEVNNNGTASARATIAMTLNPALQYHANVYWGSQVTDVTNVMMCANLIISR